MPRDAQDNLAQIFEDTKKSLDRKIKLVRSTQARLPKSNQDYSQYENLIDDLIVLEARKSDHVYAKVFCDNLIVLYCGNCLKFGRLIPNKKKTKNASKEVMDLILQPVKGKKKVGVFQDISVSFTSGIEIIKVIETLNKNVL